MTRKHAKSKAASDAANQIIAGRAILAIKNFPANPPSPIQIGDQFPDLPLGSKFHKKGDDPKNIYELRKSPHGYRYLFCKQNCEFVRETTVSLKFIQIG